MTRESLWRWAPTSLLVLGAALTVGIQTQNAVALRVGLDTVVPETIEGFTGRDIVVSEEEIRVAGVTNYLMREYYPVGGAAPQSASTAGNANTAAAAAAFSVYIGYYDSQTQGRTIHSPKNCLPGAGWDALQSRQITLPTPAGPIPVNRYLLQRGDERALVIYWYQGRGRVESSEYMVKAQLLRDAALRGRSEEALVRIVVPVGTDEDRALEIATRAAATLVPAVDRALPAS